jgi:polyisoprenoid-binding protein YceI
MRLRSFHGSSDAPLAGWPDAAAARRSRCRGVAVALLATFALAACAPPPRGGTAAPTAVPGGSATAAPEARAAIYDVDPARSELRVLAFRSGPLARLGHNHVLISRDLRGEVRVPDDASQVAFTLAFPVAALALDEPAARAEEGAEFESRPTASDVEGTRRNLLGPQVLDAAQFPEIRLVASGASGGPEAWRVRVRVAVRGRTAEVEAPVTVTRDGELLRARGELRVAQTALGMTPFSVAFGALQVQDEMTVRYSVTATRRR